MPVLTKQVSLSFRSSVVKLHTPASRVSRIAILHCLETSSPRPDIFHTYGAGGIVSSPGEPELQCNPRFRDVAGRKCENGNSLCHAGLVKYECDCKTV